MHELGGKRIFEFLSLNVIWVNKISLIGATMKAKKIFIIVILFFSLISSSVFAIILDSESEDLSSLSGKDLFNHGRLFLSGEGEKPQDFKKAFKLFQQAGDRGFLAGYVIIGLGHLNGEGVDQNKKEAAKWFLKAADQGDPDGAYFLGGMYENGEGVEKNLNKAILYHLSSASQGNSKSQLSLARIFQEGIVLPRSEKAIFFWNMRAAENGDAMAQFNIGSCYLRGVSGVEKDEKKAKYWFEKSASQGFDKAKEAISVLSR